MLRTYEHTCTTTFASSVNPFQAALPYMTHKVKEAPRRPLTKFATKPDIMRLLSDGKRRKVKEVAEELGGNETSVAKTLSAMAQIGMIRVEWEPQPRNRPSPVYSVWSAK